MLNGINVIEKQAVPIAAAIPWLVRLAPWIGRMFGMAGRTAATTAGAVPRAAGIGSKIWSGTKAVVKNPLAQQAGMMAAMGGFGGSGKPPMQPMMGSGGVGGGTTMQAHPLTTAGVTAGGLSERSFAPQMSQWTSPTMGSASSPTAPQQGS